LAASAVALGCDVTLYTIGVKNGIPPAIAGAIGYVAGLVVHYALSTSWVFPSNGGTRRAFPTFTRFAATGLLGLATTAIIIDMLTASGICGAFPAKAIAVGFTYGTVFLARRIYVFPMLARADRRCTGASCAKVLQR
jgi:putative flippase GtrA